MRDRVREREGEREYERQSERECERERERECERQSKRERERIGSVRNNKRHQGLRECGSGPGSPDVISSMSL